MPFVPALTGMLHGVLGKTLPGMPALGRIAEEPPAQPMKPVKLWDLTPKHHCPVVGTCLRMEDLVRFARRHAFEAALHDEFELHVEAVGLCQTRNALSEGLQKFLDRKYAASLTRFAKLKSDAAVLAAWRECLSKGDVAGPLWASYTHKAASAQTRDVVYADIHMLSHQVGAGQAADARRLAFLEKENAELRRTIEAEAKQHQAQTAKLKHRLSELEANLCDRAKLEEELTRLRDRLAQAESSDASTQIERLMIAVQRANAQADLELRRSVEFEQALQTARRQVTELEHQQAHAAAERDALERILTASRRTDDSCDMQCACCDHAMTQRCVLYVGGRTSLVAQYRELAEQLGVRLVHHDGGQEEALSRLPELINKADAVLCPTDCVSHTAYYSLKTHCKRSGKPCLFFKGTGVASFAVAMTRIAKGEFSLPGQVTHTESMA